MTDKEIYELMKRINKDVETILRELKERVEAQA
jgi:hypothetical protein